MLQHRRLRGRRATPIRRLRAPRALASVLPALLLAGCLQAPAPPPPPPVPPPPAAAPAGPDMAQVRRLLDLAEQHLEKMRLTTPAGDNALEVYAEIARLDPASDEPMRGRERIVELYLGTVERSLARGDVDWAREYLQRARGVDSEHPGIAPIAERVEMFASARKKRFRLDPASLSARGDGVGAELARIGGEAKATSALVRIFARSDAEGRWIYERLSAAPGDARLRAQVEIASPPQVELVIFDTATARAAPAGKQPGTAPTCSQPC
jgi:hypothetical protein